MSQYAQEAQTEKGIIIPNSYEVIIGCDFCREHGTRTQYRTFVNGFDDAYLAIRHVKGYLIASEGWRSAHREYKVKGVIHEATAMTCPKHRKEI